MASVHVCTHINTGLDFGCVLKKETIWQPSISVRHVIPEHFDSASMQYCHFLSWKSPRLLTANGEGLPVAD